MFMQNRSDDNTAKYDYQDRTCFTSETYSLLQWRGRSFCLNIYDN